MPVKAVSLVGGVEVRANRSSPSTPNGRRIVGVVGALQFEVLAARIETEYGLEVHFESCSFITARWIEADEPLLLKKYIEAIPANVAEDHTGAPIYLARSKWQLEHALDKFEGIRFQLTKETGQLRMSTPGV